MAEREHDNGGRRERHCLVVTSGPRELLLKRSPLDPSRPAFAGDQGWIGGHRVTDVLPSEHGLTHVLGGCSTLVPGDRVSVILDEDRRSRRARTHLAAVLAFVQLRRDNQVVTDVELTAGLAWLELASAPRNPISLQPLIDRDAQLSTRPRDRHRQIVCVEGDVLATFAGPIARRARDVAGVTVSSHPARDGHPPHLRIAIAEAADRWWR